MSSISTLTGNTSSLAALFSASSKDTSATSAFAAPESDSETTGLMGSNALSSGSGFAALDGDMQTALLSLQEEMGGTDAAMMPPPPPPESDSSSSEATASTASDSTSTDSSEATASTDSTDSTDDASSSGGTSGASGASESKEVVSTTYLDNPDGSTTITVSYSDGSTSVTTTGGEGQSATAPDAPQSNLPYSLGGGTGTTSLSQAVSNLYASVANSVALSSAAGVAA